MDRISKDFRAALRRHIEPPAGGGARVSHADSLPYHDPARGMSSPPAGGDLTMAQEIDPAMVRRIDREIRFGRAALIFAILAVGTGLVAVFVYLWGCA